MAVKYFWSQKVDYTKIVISDDQKSDRSHGYCGLLTRLIYIEKNFKFIENWNLWKVLKWPPSATGILLSLCRNPANKRVEKRCCWLFKNLIWSSTKVTQISQKSRSRCWYLKQVSRQSDLENCQNNLNERFWIWRWPTKSFDVYQNMFRAISLESRESFLKCFSVGYLFGYSLKSKLGIMWPNS